MQVVNQVFESHRTFVDCEIQQRACEYFSMNQTSDEDLLNQVSQYFLYFCGAIVAAKFLVSFAQSHACQSLTCTGSFV